MGIVYLVWALRPKDTKKLLWVVADYHLARVKAEAYATENWPKAIQVWEEGEGVLSAGLYDTVLIEWRTVTTE